MRIYDKIVELSITIVSLTTLMLSFLFPNVALASNAGTVKNNVLSFVYKEPVRVLPLVSVKNNVSLAKVIGTDNKNNKNYKASTLPVEQKAEKPKAEKVVISTLAMKISDAEEVNVVRSVEEYDKIAESICLAAGIIDQPCWQDLRAMRDKESFGGKVMVGDNGRSRGWYHIQTKLHNLPLECAMDFKCSTEWTVKNLIANGYKTNRFYAISRHNGGGVMAQNYARSVVYNSSKFE